MRYGVGSEESADRSRAKVHAAMDRLELELDAADGAHLAGGAFSVADLTAAALFYPLVFPPEGPSVPEPSAEFAAFRDPFASAAATAGLRRRSPATATAWRLRRSIPAMERVTGIGGVFQRAGGQGLLQWYAENLGVELTDWGAKPFEWTPGGSTSWAVFDHDTEYFGRPEQAFMVNFRVADLDAMLAQLRSAGVEVIEGPEDAELGRFAWAVDPEGTRFELWEPPPGG